MITKEIHPVEKTVVSRTVGNAKKTIVIMVSSGVLIKLLASIIADCSIARNVPAIRTCPFTTRIIAITADTQDMPLATKELRTPAFLIFTKKSMNIRTKKIAEIIKRNFAIDLVKLSRLSYLENKAEFTFLVKDMSLPHFFIYLSLYIAISRRL